VEDLCYDKFANYIIQVLIEKVSKFREEFSQMFIKTLDQMLSNQYASRVLQKIV
jgi:hypothetical protein